jgi:hypothetical protein
MKAGRIEPAVRTAEAMTRMEAAMPRMEPARSRMETARVTTGVTATADGMQRQGLRRGAASQQSDSRSRRQDYILHSDLSSESIISGCKRPSPTLGEIGCRDLWCS